VQVSTTSSDVSYRTAASAAAAREVGSWHVRGRFRRYSRGVRVANVFGNVLKQSSTPETMTTKQRQLTLINAKHKVRKKNNAIVTGAYKLINYGQTGLYGPLSRRIQLTLINAMVTVVYKQLTLVLKLGFHVVVEWVSVTVRCPSVCVSYRTAGLLLGAGRY